MRNFFTLIFFLLSYFFKFISARLEVTGYEYKDLEANDNCFILREVSGWAANSLAVGYSNPPYSTTCSNPTITYLMGGYAVLGGSNQNNNYFARTFTGLKTHYYVRWTLSFYPMRSWDVGVDTYKIGINDLIVPGQTLSAGMFTSTLCGGSISSLRVRVFGTAPHTASTLTFKVISGLDQSSADESFGFRELNILVDANPPPYPQLSSLCGRSPTTTAITDKQCQCPEGQWNNGGCVLCHTSCSSCYGGTPRDCFQCKSGYSWDGFECAACTTYTDTCQLTSTDQLSLRCQPNFALFKAANRCYYDCWYPLAKTTDACDGIECSTTCTGFIYWNKVCGSSCNAPLQQSFFPGNVKLCIYPCGSRDYLYWDGTCDEDCPIPFTRNVLYYKNLCEFPCSLDLFLYPDSSCLGSCAFPLVQKSVHGKIICTTPCNLPGEHVYLNGECSISCPWPLTTVISNGIRYCSNTCAGPNYLFWNGSCLATCPGPLKIRIERSKYYCDFPTDVPTGDFLYWDGRNSPTCYPPLRQRIEGTYTIRKFCDFPCLTYQYLYPDGICSNDCVFPWTKRVVGGFRFCDYRCTGTEALFWNGTCRSSSNCVAPLILTALRSYQLCEFPTGNVSNFLYWDGTFSPDCDFPLVQRIDGNPLVRKFCESPCSTPTPYLWWDGVCRASCSPPFLSTSVGVKLFCSSPCENPDFFLYDDESCAEDCNFPYVAEFDGAGKFCHYPCSKTSLFYYYNSSCLSACEFPLRVSVMEKVKWCFYPCSEDQFLYTNGTCIDTCEKPFNQYLGWDFKYCNNPCLADPLKPYLMWNGTCLSSCEAPMRIDNSTNMGELCYGPCNNSEEFYYVKTGECKAECETSSIDNSGLYLKCFPPVYIDTTTFLDVLLESPKDDEKEGAVTLVKLARIVEYTRYLDIEFPSRLQRLAESKGRGIVTIRCGPEMPKSTKASFTKYKLPDVFERYSDLHSNFLVNFWKEMSTWIIVVFAAILLIAAEEVCVKNEWTGVLSVVEKLRIIFKWNYLLILIGTSLGDIILYSSLQFRTFHAHESFAALSMETCLAMISLGVILLMATYYVARKVDLLKNDETMTRQTISEALVKFRDYQVFYQGVNENILTNRIFYLLYALRLCLPMIIASYLYSTPMTQTILYIIISVVTIGYIWLAKPIKKKMNYIQMIILEYFVLTINICLLILTCLHSYGRRYSSFGIALGDIIIFCNTGIHILLIVILILKIVQGCLAVHKYFKLDPKQRLSNPWAKILVGILQQGGMGFEEIEFEGIEYDEFEPRFDKGLMITQKGISAKIRTWESVHHDPRRVTDYNKLRNPKVQEDHRLNTAESEDMSLNVKNYNVTDDEAYKIKNPPITIPSTTKVKSASLPKTYNQNENNSLSDLVLRKNVPIRTDERNTVVMSSRNQKDTFVDPDIMQGIKLSHLKKMDLRSVEK